MFGRKREPVCVIAGGPCPRTSNPQAERFCPFWSDAPHEWTHRITGAKTYENCGARMLWAGTLEAIGSARSMAHAYEEDRNAVTTFKTMLGQLVGRPLPQQPPPIRAIEGDGI